VYSGYGRQYSRGNTGVTTDVNDPSSTWFNQEPHWLLIEDLAGGTYSIRMKHRRYLPQEPREQDDSYENRLARSTCPPYFQRLERMLAGMLTRKPVKLQDINDTIREQLFDVDLQGNDLNIWTYETARKMIRYGHVGVLVDTPAEGNGRPYWVAYTPREILGYRTELINGKTTFTQLRLMEKVYEAEGEYGEKLVEQVRVLYPGRYEIHRKNDDGRYKVFDEGNTTTTEIPFAVAYSNRVSLMESRPPLEDIAELNIKAYQVQSDLDNQLHISAVPLLGFFGFPQSSEEVSAGPGEAIAFPADGRAEYIEPTGRSFNSQFQRLDQLAQQINELGLAAVLGQKLSAETAEAKRIDRSQGDSTMMVVAQQMQDLIDNCLTFHAQYLNTSEVGSSFVNRDFLSTRLEPQEIQSLLQLYTAGTITQKTLLDQLTQGEVLGDEFDVEEEIEATQTGGLMEMAPPEPEDEEEPEDQEDEPEAA
tara:strand:- start:17503 stop:18933 length:1431 start_codon:yes stop_codon:yes gene_type:complete